MRAWKSLRPALQPLRLLGARSLTTEPKLPSGIPAQALVQLPRTVVAVYGKDTPKYLNGLITVRPPEPRPDIEQPQAAAYTAMLNAKGRIICDAFVYAAHDNPEVQADTGARDAFCYLLEIDSRIVEKVVDILDFHILMSDVEIKVLDNYKVWSAWNDVDVVNTGEFGEHNLWTEDMRAPGLGYRIVGKSLSEQGHEIATAAEYNLRRYLCGVPEGPDELIPGKTLPLDACIDYMGGIDFNKGCYLGQELTIRTHHHGTVRKRIAPIVLMQNPDDELPDELYIPQEFDVSPGTDITDANPVPHQQMVSPIFGESPFKTSGATPRQRPAGSIVSTIGNVGLATIRLDKLGHDFRVNDYYVKALTPYWWPSESTNETEAEEAPHGQA